MRDLLLTRTRRAASENLTTLVRSVKRFVRPRLAEAAGNIIFGLFFARVGEDFYCWSELDQFAEVKESGEIGNAAGLLHIVSDDHDCVLRLERLDEFLDFRCGDRI